VKNLPISQIFENLACGELVCACMATETLLVTGDQNTVVRVWAIPAAKDRNKSMTLVKVTRIVTKHSFVMSSPERTMTCFSFIQALYGHTKPVTSVCACASYGVIVSGSEDGSCILWDLNHLAFIRQLFMKDAPAITLITINEKTVGGREQEVALRLYSFFHSALLDKVISKASGQ